MERIQARKKGEKKREVFSAFWSRPMTMFTAGKKTGILRSTICSYVADWKKQGVIFGVKKDFCPYTGHKATFYTTSKELYERLTDPESTNSVTY